MEKNLEQEKFNIPQFFLIFVIKKKIYYIQFIEIKR